MALKWRTDLETGVELIDDQHKELFRVINELLTACSEGRGKAEVADVMKFLGDYVVTHFTAEKTYMEKYSYPDAVSHLAAHDAFVKTFGELNERFQAEGATLTFVMAINKTVVDWLVQHIGQVDKKLGLYLQEQGV